MADMSGAEWSRPAEVVNGVSTVSVIVRYPDGRQIPVALPAGMTAREYAGAIERQLGYVIVGVRIR